MQFHRKNHFAVCCLFSQIFRIKRAAKILSQAELFFIFILCSAVKAQFHYT
jgi:hypothetical protein